jgi:hypothetical protein
MEILIGLVAVLTGASLGGLLTFSTVPRMRWVEVGAVVVLVGCAVAIMLTAGVPWWTGPVFAAASALATLLAGGAAWAEHPQLAGRGYWSRVATWTAHGAWLSSTWDTYQDELADPVDPDEAALRADGHRATAE